MENRRSIYSFFSWKYVVLAALFMFVFTMILEYLFDRKDYPSMEILFRENAIRKGIMALVISLVIAYFRAKELRKEYEMNAD